MVIGREPETNGSEDDMPMEMSDAARAAVAAMAWNYIGPDLRRDIKMSSM